MTYGRRVCSRRLPKPELHAVKQTAMNCNNGRAESATKALSRASAALRPTNNRPYTAFWSDLCARRCC